MKFIADAMLGKLAKRLRLLGFDVLYDAALSDNEIIRRSRESDRTILTRDRGLASRPLAERHLFILSDHIDEQLAQVLGSFPAPPASEAFTRCSICNEPLVPVPPEAARDYVPPFVLRSRHDYLFCRVCEKAYWKGTHVRRMDKKSRRP